MNAIGEITNMISGQTRQKLGDLDRSLKAAMATLIMAENYTIIHITKHPIIAIPFATHNAEFTGKVYFEE
jgi:chemotaxis protein CheX